MRFLSLILYFLVLLPIGYARKILRYSAFAEPAYRRTSSWNSVRAGHEQSAQGRSRMDEQPAPAGQK